MESSQHFDYKSKKMKKIVIYKPGGYEELKLEEHEIPKPKEGEVLIEVHAFGRLHQLLSSYTLLFFRVPGLSPGRTWNLEPTAVRTFNHNARNS